MLPSHLNGHSPLARRRPRLSTASAPAAGVSPAAGAATASAAAPLEEHDRIYFQSYSHIGIHEAMIKDRIRTDAYHTAIMHHQKFIEGKVVMDVGCGTGILSVFCARAGAKCSVLVQAREIVKANNLSDQIVVIHGRVEDVDIEEKVDVIISEWMGYMLLYESMLPSVLFARDKWLKPGGLILPSHATLFLAPITNPERYEGSVDFWNDVYGINTPVHGFGLWFEVEFNGPAESSHNFPSNLNPLDIIQKKRRRGSDDTVLLSTAPEDEPTHWQQTILYFPDPAEVKQDQVIEGSISITQSEENPRFLNINLECS
ncbi:hypothetical protein PR202_ga18582 [Eleusine coracana subsp. coracana]|uniref:Protein arginine N-methyltransferase 6 n=1 Tax=Eleusine coracana subsp. coracana TaxID=191504 RepID=A0AAV5CT80_ELECO|nr:hypothetical protein PR202_ga18582 [Eleusine coracana subsp. coracana]